MTSRLIFLHTPEISISCTLQQNKAKKPFSKEKSVCNSVINKKKNIDDYFVPKKPHDQSATKIL